MIIKKCFCKHFLRSNYGQAGVLKIKIDSIRSDLAFYTIWEDFTEIALEKSLADSFHFWEEGKSTFFTTQNRLKEDSPIPIQANIPEYYSIEAKLWGNLDFTRPNTIS